MHLVPPLIDSLLPHFYRTHMISACATSVGVRSRALPSHPFPRHCQMTRPRVSREGTQTRERPSLPPKMHTAITCAMCVTSREKRLDLDHWREPRDRVGDVVRRDERHDTNHREAAVLQLGGALAGECLGGERLGEAEGIPEEGDLAGGAAVHVVRLDGGLAKELQDANHTDDLKLARLRARIPRGVAVTAQALEGDALLDREVAREQGAT